MARVVKVRTRADCQFCREAVIDTWSRPSRQQIEQVLAEHKAHCDKAIAASERAWHVSAEDAASWR